MTVLITISHVLHKRVRRTLRGMLILKELQHSFVLLETLSLNFSIVYKFVISNPSQCSTSVLILLPLWFIFISLVFFSLSKLPCSGFLQFKGYFVGGSSNTQYFKVPLLSSFNFLEYLPTNFFVPPKVCSRVSSV